MHEEGNRLQVLATLSQQARQVGHGKGDALAISNLLRKIQAFHVERFRAGSVAQVIVGLAQVAERQGSAGQVTEFPPVDQAFLVELRGPRGIALEERESAEARDDGRDIPRPVHLASDAQRALVESRRVRKLFL